MLLYHLRIINYNNYYKSDVIVYYNILYTIWFVYYIPLQNDNITKLNSEYRYQKC